MENNSNQVLPRFAIKFANKVFLLGWVGSVLVAVYAVYKIYVIPVSIAPTLYYSCILLTVFTATFFGFGLSRLPDELKVNLSILLVSVGIAVPGVEIYFELSYETRNKTQVIEDLIKSGVETYPNVAPADYIISNGLNTAKGSIYPFGGISNTTTIFANESGYYPIIETDGHGFNNPKGLYRKGRLDILVLGDSFVEGYSVDSNQNISAELRASGFNAINIGKAANGPLIELAALKEYAEPLEPKIVLWVYYVNDLGNLEREITSSLLMKYLHEDNFSQNLISRQEEIDSALINYIQDESEKLPAFPQNHWALRILKLRNLRSGFSLTPAPVNTPAPVSTPGPVNTPAFIPMLPMFKDVLRKSKQMISGWGGEMYFVYLPSFYQYSVIPPPSEAVLYASADRIGRELGWRPAYVGLEEEYLPRELILRTATELEIPIIDIHHEVFVPHRDPLSLFPFRAYGHYTADGYRLVSETISSRLKLDGIVPLNSRN